MGGGRGGGGRAPAPPPAPPQPDWNAIFAAERAAQERQLAQMRAEAEKQRQLEEQRRAEEEAKRKQTEWDATQRLKDEQSLENYKEAKQAAAAQVTGGTTTTPVTTRVTAETPAPGLEQTPPTRFRGANQAYAPSGVSVGGRISRFLGGGLSSQ
jgi:hypothetical protein